MLGFMMKDFLYFRRNTRLFALMVVLYLVFGFSMSNVAAISGMLSMLGLIVVVFLLIFGGAALLSRDGSVSRAISQAAGDELPTPVLLCTALISLALYYVSYRASLRVYINREF